jgi:iron(III) transport system substrate-binding protein
MKPHKNAARASCAGAVAMLLALGLSAAPAAAQGTEVNVYTYRESKLIQPLFDAFTKDTGIKVNVATARCRTASPSRSPPTCSPKRCRRSCAI